MLHVPHGRTQSFIYKTESKQCIYQFFFGRTTAVSIFGPAGDFAIFYQLIVAGGKLLVPIDNSGSQRRNIITIGSCRFFLCGGFRENGDDFLGRREWFSSNKDKQEVFEFSWKKKISCNCWNFWGWPVKPQVMRSSSVSAFYNEISYRLWGITDGQFLCSCLLSCFVTAYTLDLEITIALLAIQAKINC